VRDKVKRHYVFFPRTLISAQKRISATVHVWTALDQYLSESAGIAQPEVHTLPGQRMNCMRGIADEGCTRFHEARHTLSLQGKCGSGSERLQASEHAFARLLDAVTQRLG
jgi:hypothetical protein